MTLLKFFFGCGLLVHYMACLWAYTGLTWTPGDKSLETETTWVAYYGMSDYPPHRLYAISLYVSLVAIYGSVSNLTPRNFMEYGVISAMMFVGGMVWAYVISALCGIFSTLNP